MTKLWIGLTVIGGLVLLGLLVFSAQVLLSKPVAPQGPLPTALLITTTPLPTPTPTQTPLPTPTPTPLPPTPTPIAGLGIGSRVRVVGTGDFGGVNIRSEPSTSAPRVDIGREGEEFIIAAGPELAEGITWWFIRDPNIPTREGWAASNYLDLVVP